MNTATIIGRAGQDAEIRYFESGKVKTTFSLAVGQAGGGKSSGEHHAEVKDCQIDC